MRRRLLITGCQRSGTKWMADALRLAGVDCGHERVYGIGKAQEHGWEAESSWMAAPYTRNLTDPSIYIVHLVRHPYHVIRSSAERGTFGPPKMNEWGEYARYWCPDIELGANRVERAAIYWREWNALVQADRVVRLEEVDAMIITYLAQMVNPNAWLGELPPPSNVQDPELRSRHNLEIYSNEFEGSVRNHLNYNDLTDYGHEL